VGYGLLQGFSGYAQGLQAERARDDQLRQQALANSLGVASHQLGVQQLAQQADLERERLAAMAREGELNRASQEKKWTMDDVLAWAELNMRQETQDIQNRLLELEAQLKDATLPLQVRQAAAEALSAEWVPYIHADQHRMNMLNEWVKRGVAGAEVMRGMWETYGTAADYFGRVLQNGVLAETLRYLPARNRAQIENLISSTGINIEQAAGMKQEREQSAELFPYVRTEAEERAKQAGQLTSANMPAAQAEGLRASASAARAGAQATLSKMKDDKQALMLAWAEYMDARRSGDENAMAITAANVIRAREISAREVAQLREMLNDRNTRNDLDAAGLLDKTLADLQEAEDEDSMWRVRVQRLGEMAVPLSSNAGESPDPRNFGTMTQER